MGGAIIKAPIVGDGSLEPRCSEPSGGCSAAGLKYENRPLPIFRRSRILALGGVGRFGSTVAIMSLIEPIQVRAVAFFGRHKGKFIAVGIGLLLLAVLFVFQKCGKPKPKLNEKEIQAAEIAVEEHNDQKLKEILATADAKEEIIAGNVANSKVETINAVEAAKKKYENMNTDELAKELESRK